MTITLPRNDSPSWRTLWNSARNLSRRDLGNERDFDIWRIAAASCTVKVFAGSPAKTFQRRSPSQGEGEALALDVEVDEEDEEVPVLGEAPVLIVVFVSVVLDTVGEGFTTVVLFSDFAGGFAVSVLCSQAASREAALATMQMYFFIGYGWKPVSG